MSSNLKAALLFQAFVFWGFGGFAQEPYRHYFEGETSRRLFKCRMEIADQELTGLLLVKRTAADDFRMVFTTETGFKLFDMSMSSGSYTLHTAPGPIEKKMVSKRIALTLQAAVLRPLNCGYPSGEADGPLFSCGKLKYKFALKMGGNIPEQVLLKRGGKVKAAARFGPPGENSGLADSIRVEHGGFPLKAYFRLMNP